MQAQAESGEPTAFSFHHGTLTRLGEQCHHPVSWQSATSTRALPCFFSGIIVCVGFVPRYRCRTVHLAEGLLGQDLVGSFPHPQDRELTIISQPRAYTLGDHPLSALRPGPISWVMPFFRVTDSVIFDLCGLDSYLFLRYLRTMVLLFGPLSLVIVPSLLSLNLVKASGSRNRVHGMDELSWSNVATADTARLWGHLCCAVCIVIYFCFVITHELNYYTRFLQIHSASRSSRSHFVLLTDIPDGMQNENTLREFFKKLPGRLQHVEILYQDKVLSASISRRHTVLADLEAAETKLIKKAQANQSRGAAQRMILDGQDGTGTKSLSSFYVGAAERKQTYLWGVRWTPRLPFLGRHEDKIVVLRKELAELNQGIEKQQQAFESAPRLPSAILQFPSKFLAHAVVHSISHPFPNCMLTHYLGTLTDDIIWCNLGSTWWERQLRSVLVFVLSVALVLGWTVPIASTGVLSQLSYLAELFAWLAWVRSLPVWVVALLQGVLPQMALSVLMLIFPEILRTVINQRRQFTKSAVELSLQKYYFAFLFVHLFLTVSISSGIVTVLAQTLNSTEFGPVILAQNLPKASNYFLSYVLLQAFFVSGSIFVQLTGAFRYAVNKITANTPREHARKTYMSVIQWGTFFPVYTNLGCIGRSNYHSSHLLLTIAQ